MNAWNIGLRHNPEPPEARDLSAEYDRREREIWADPVLVSEAMQSLDCLEVTERKTYTDHEGRGRIIPARSGGLPAVDALRSQDFAELGRLIHAEVTKVIRQRAVDEVDEENDQ